MRATIYSGAFLRLGELAMGRKLGGPTRLFLALTCLLSLSLPAHGEETFAQRAERLYQAAKDQYAKESTNVVYAWQLGRACFDWAEFAASDDAREALANEGIAACRLAIERDPKLAPAYYYLAMDLGQLARTKTLGALPIVDEMEKTFKKARELDEKFDYAGPDRNLGLLYFDAPGWPASIGSRSKARSHLERAIKVCADYPDNYLNLIEAELKWGEISAARKLSTRLGDLWQAAKARLTGAEWASSWADWDKRWEQIQKKLKTKSSSRP